MTSAGWDGLGLAGVGWGWRTKGGRLGLGIKESRDKRAAYISILGTQGRMDLIWMGYHLSSYIGLEFFVLFLCSVCWHSARGA